MKREGVGRGEIRERDEDGRLNLETWARDFRHGTVLF